MTRGNEPGDPGATRDGPELSVIVPCLNEELNLPELIARVLGTFRRGDVSGELVIVDDGSTDGTARLLRDEMQRNPGAVVGVFHPENRGIARAWRSGAEAARGRLVAIIDADLQYQPEDLLRLRRALYEHAVDVVQGFRSPTGRRRDDRYALSRGFNALLNGVFSMHLRDNKSGFVMCAREVFLDLLSYRGNYYYWQSFIMVAAHAKGYSYREVETLFEERRQGTSFLAGSNALKASARSFVDLARATWEYRIRRPPESLARQLEGAPPAPRRPLEAVRWRAAMAVFDRTHAMITRDVERHHALLSRTQWSSKAAQIELGEEKLRRLLRHAYRNVPYYRTRMQERGIRPEDLRGAGDLARLPILTRALVREHLYFDILSENHDKDQVLRVTGTGGIGEPAVSFVDRAQLELRWAAELRAREWTGYRLGDGRVELYGGPSARSLRSMRSDFLAAHAEGRSLVFASGPRVQLERAVRRLEKSEPALLEGDAESLELLARFVAARPGPRPRVTAIVSYGEALSDGVRRMLEATFGAGVFDTYGTRELGLVAHECEAHAGLHVVAESFLVEILVGDRRAEPFEEGDVVVTSLDHYCMPLLRYRTGDRAVALPDAPRCPCGRSAPRIGSIVGRPRSVLVGPRGQCIPGARLERDLADFDYVIRRFRIRQERVGEVSFRFEKGARYSDEALDKALFGLRFLGKLEVASLSPDDRGPPVESRVSFAFDERGEVVVGEGPRPPDEVPPRAG